MLERVLASCCMLLLFGSVTYGQTKSAVFDGLVDTPSKLSGQPAFVQLMSGVVIENTEIVTFIQDRQTKSVTFVQYKDGRRKPKRKSSDVYGMIISGRPYGFRFHGPTNGYYLIDKRQAKQTALTRMSRQESGLRDLLTREETREAVSKQEAFLNDARKKLGTPELALYSSQFSLLLTDYPEPAARQLGKHIDGVCQNLNVLFRMPRELNIWHGKIVVAAFSKQPLYGSFESKILNNPNFGTSKTIYHSKADKFLVVCHGPEMSKSFAKNVCWGVAGGYVGRYRSNVKMPDWLRVGTRGWITNAMFPQPKTVASMKKRAKADFERNNSLLGILTATDLDKDRRALAHLLVSFLIAQSPHAFGQFFKDIKHGHSFENSLQLNYGMTADLFAARFGQSVGVRGVLP